MNLSRLRQLERKTENMVRHKRQLACVTFADGTVQRMPALSVIDLLHSAEAGNIVDITGERSPGSGRLLELLRGLVVEVP